MRIINTDKKLKVKSQNFYFCLRLFVFCFLFFSLLTGCTKKDGLEEARTRAAKSDVYYQHSIEWYKSLIAKAENLDLLHFELGRLYFSHGEFEKAKDLLKKSAILQASKLLALSYYQLADYTKALEVFNKSKILDDEYLYYYGLTCEKLNLFDQALDVYKKIKGNKFTLLAEARTNIIQKQSGPASNIEKIGPKIHAIIQAAPSEKDYPQAGALILYCDEKITVTSQDTQVTDAHYVIKILNERGKENFSETHVEYDSTYEKVELEFARTIKPDGTVVEVGSRHMRDVSKYLNFPLYSNVRVYIISFPEVTLGAAIEYRLKVYRNQLINKKDFVLSYSLQTSEPVISASLTLDLPKAKVLHLKNLNTEYNNFDADLKPKIQETGGRLIYSWRFKNIPQILPESNMPANVEINPAMLMSTFSSWQEVYKWWWGLAQDKIKADKAIEDKVNELTAKLSSQEEKIRAIYNFCAQEIRYVAVEYGQAGYEPHKAEDIFKNKYGDCKDQAILLVTMLKFCKIPAWPVLIPSRDCYNLNRDFPSLLFDHCIAAVSVKDKIIFLDPTAQTCPFNDLPGDDQDRQVLLFKPDKYEILTTPLYPAQHNLVRKEANIGISLDEGITVKKDIFTYGIYDQAQRYWLLFTPPQLIEEKLKEMIQDVSIGADLNKYEIKNLQDLNQPVVLSYSFSGPEYLTQAGNLRIMPQLADIDTSLVAKDSRRFPIDFGVLDQKQTILEYEIPQNFAVKYMPESVIKDSPWLKFSAQYSRQGSKLIFKQSVELKKNIIEKQDYPAFKDFLNNLAKGIKQRVILEKVK